LGRHVAGAQWRAHNTRLMPPRALLAALLITASCAAAGQDAAALVERASTAMRRDPEEARSVAEQALAQLAKSPDPDLQVRAHLVLCDYHAERNRVDAQHQADLARALLPRVRRSGLRAGLLSCEGEMHENAGDNARAMSLYELAVAAAEGARDDEMLANALFLRGYLRGLHGEFALGLADLRRAHTLYEKLALAVHMVTVSNAIAILYNRMGDHDQARHYYEAALKAQRAQGLRREETVTLHNLGRVHEDQEDWDAAQRRFGEVLALARSLSYPRGEAYALRGLASVANARKRPHDALQLLQQAEKIGAADERLRAQVLLQRGIAWRQLQRPADAAAVLRQALDIFKRAESAHEVGLVHHTLAQALTDLGDWRGAYDEHVRFKAVSDGLLRRQLDQRFATLKIEFDTAAKDRENALLLRENAATERALDHERRAGRLQAMALALAALLAVVLAAVAWRHHGTSRRMRELALTDELTGLPNRRCVLERLAAQVARTDARCAVLIADLDHFKSINDRHGHLVGDEVLRAVATALRDSARDPVLLGRLGGEEFVAVLPDATPAAARQFGERLREAVAAIDLSVWLPGRVLTISVGATVSQPGDDVGRMLQRADDALYAAKEAGRDRTVVAPSISQAQLQLA
jgi:diguanylate cyclase (GGDEF)-like protein